MNSACARATARLGFVLSQAASDLDENPDQGEEDQDDDSHKDEPQKPGELFSLTHAGDGRTFVLSCQAPGPSPNRRPPRRTFPFLRLQDPPKGGRPFGLLHRCLGTNRGLRGIRGAAALSSRRSSLLLTGLCALRRGGRTIRPSAPGLSFKGSVGSRVRPGRVESGQPNARQGDPCSACRSRRGRRHPPGRGQ
jgi:hypothetical protein